MIIKLAAYAKVITTVPVIQWPLPTTNTATSFKGSTRHTGMAKIASDWYGPSLSMERLTFRSACLMHLSNQPPCFTTFRSHKGSVPRKDSVASYPLPPWPPPSSAKLFHF
jgi:hypothetical protein